MIRRTWLYLTPVIILLLTACIRQTAPADAPMQDTLSAAATGPAVVRIGRKGSPDSLNPGVAQLSEASSIFALVYDFLFNLELDGTYSPILTESYQASDDGLVWTFKIRPNFKFHDGQPLTAKDVAFSYNFYKANADFPLLNAYTQFFDTIEAPDDYTLMIKLTQAIPNLESHLYSLPVLPEHIWAAHTEGKEPVEFLNEGMIGSGPFKLLEYKQNEFVHLAANKEHPLTPPKVDEVIFQVFANEDALVQAIQTGQVDMISELPNTAMATLRTAENVKLVIGAPLYPEAADIAINQIKPEDCPTEAGGKCTGHPALRDRNVRLALAHATDKQNLIDVLLLGLGKPGLTLIPHGLGPWYNHTLQDYPFDITVANQILDDAGYLDTDGDGVREMPDGMRPLIFRLQWPSDLITAPIMAELLSQTWSQIGIQVEPQAVDPDTLIALCCPGFDYDLMVWNWYSDPDPDFLLKLMSTEAILGASNESGYSNPEYDDLYNRQGAELELEKRQALVWQMQEIVHSDVVYIIPYYPQQVQAYRTDRFTGWLSDQSRLALEARSSLVRLMPIE
jgi:peptide/nickel transport system substrate-binding protein